jgi:hypothetical protein|tara:strand:- start:3272 stop:3640 length:369 start_codon:yes stop_codon:yes gene_type:complete
MRLFDELNSENFFLFASKHYVNKQCTEVEEFYEDLNRFKYLKRLLRRYEASGELQERLILNHLIVIFNVFGIESATRMVFFKTDVSSYPQLKTFLVYLNYLKEDEHVEIPLDSHIVSILRNL